MDLQIAKAYSFFNLITLLFNLMRFILNYYLNFKEGLYYLYMTIILQLLLIILSFLHYFLMFSSPLNTKKLNKFLILLINKIFDLAPIFEILIEINLEFRFYIHEEKFYWFYSIRFIYFLFKPLMITLKNDQSAIIAILSNSFFFLIIMINLCVIFTLNNLYLLIIIFAEIFLMLYSLNVLIRMHIASQNKEVKIYQSYLNEMSESVTIIKVIPSKKKHIKNYQILYNNRKTLEIFKITDKNSLLTFKVLNKKIRNFRFNKTKIFQKTINGIKNLYPMQSLRLMSFDSLFEMLSFYNSYQDNDIFITFLRLTKHDSECTEKQESCSLNLKLTLKKSILNNTDYFFIHIKEIEKIIKIKETSEFKTRLLNSISHELKTPLNGSLTLLELLRNEKCVENDVSSFYLDNCLASLKLLENTLNNIIDYSLIISEQFIICMSNVNLKNLMNEIFMITKSQVELKNVDYMIELDGLLSKRTIYTDYHRLKQIILNILLNSIQFTNKGLIRIKISVISHKPFSIEISIKDTGIGMEVVFCENLINKINDKNEIFQANTTGSCMGMIISHKLALLLGKTGIQIDSKLNEGTEVKFLISDQNFDICTESKGDKSPLENIIIPERNKERYTSIMDFSKKIEWMRRKNKSLRKKDNTIESFFDDSEEDFLKRNATDTHTHNSLITNLKAHNFDKLKKSQIWSEKTVLVKSKRNLFINEQRHHSLTFISEKIDNPSLFSENFITQPLVLTSRSVIPNPECRRHKLDKSLHPIENIDCKCEDILVVDDDAFNLLSLELILKSFNVKCQKAMNGRDAIDKILSQKCDSIHCRGFKLVFMDYQMPIMDGVESTIEIMRLSENRDIGRVTVIGCTAFTTKTEVTNCLNAGMKDVIFKPLSKEIVGNILKEWMGS